MCEVEEVHIQEREAVKEKERGNEREKENESENEKEKGRENENEKERENTEIKIGIITGITVLGIWSSGAKHIFEHFFEQTEVSWGVYKAEYVDD